MARRYPALSAAAMALVALAGCQPERPPVAGATVPVTADPEPVAAAPTDPADPARGAAGEPAPTVRDRAAPLPPAPQAAAGNPTASRPVLPRHVPARGPSGARYRPRPPHGELTAALYDPGNPALALLQRPADGLAGLPADRSGGVDWVVALASGAIRPRATTRGEAPMPLRDGDLIMRDTAAMPWVLFPHRAHTEWLACGSCHPAPFEAGEGANDIRMDDIFRGRWCGRCHDRVAFPTLSCERCHSVLHEGSPRAWWETPVPP